MMHSTRLKSRLALAILAAALSAFALPATAQQWTDPYASSGSDFEGLYVGITGGGFWDPNSAHLTGGDTAASSVGGVAGVNMYVTDTIVAGVEVQGSANFGPSAITYDAFGLGRVGMAPSDNIMFYGTAGPGFSNGTNVYAAGAGVEFAATDNLGVRGEALAVGTWGAMPDSAKVNGGILWHMD